MRHHAARARFRGGPDAATIDDMAKGPEKRDIRFSMRIPASMHARLRRASELDRRTMADFVIIVVEKALDEFEAAHPRRR